MSYDRTRARVEDYFDKTATRTWERLTSDAPVSRIRQTVRAGRDEMRAMLLSRLPRDLTGRRVLDAGCGAGQMTAELALRGAEVVAADISPSLIEIARDRLQDRLRDQVTFYAGDMLEPALGRFDHVVAMDSLIYYTKDDIAKAIGTLANRAHENIVFTIAPRTRALMAMWYAGKIFPRGDRSPVMIPHVPAELALVHGSLGYDGALYSLGRVASGFYISAAMEWHR